MIKLILSNKHIKDIAYNWETLIINVFRSAFVSSDNKKEHVWAMA